MKNFKIIFWWCLLVALLAGFFVTLNMAEDRDTRRHKKEKDLANQDCIMDGFCIEANNKKYLCKNFDILIIDKLKSEANFLLGVGAKYSHIENSDKFKITTYKYKNPYGFRDEDIISVILCDSYEINRIKLKSKNTRSYEEQEKL